MLTERQVEDVCLIGEGVDCCRYCRMDGSGKYLCDKLTSAKDNIDKRVSNDQSLGGGYFPSGDNCRGYPLLKYVPQGYDVDVKP